MVVIQGQLVCVAYRRELCQEVYYCRKFGAAGHLNKRGLDIPEQEYLSRLLGKLNYVLQISPGDSSIRDAREWVSGELRRLSQRTAPQTKKSHP